MMELVFERSDNGPSATFLLAEDAKFVDLEQVAHRFGLQKGLTFQTGENTITIEPRLISIDKLYEACKVERTSPFRVIIDDNGQERVTPVCLTVLKKQRTWPSRPSWEQVVAWVQELNEDLVGHDISASTACKDHVRMDVSSQEVFDQILDLYLRAELASDSNLKVLEVTLTIKKGPLKAFSKFVGDRGVQDGMKVLLGTAYDLRQQSHIQPVEVPELVHYPLYSLEPHLNTTVPKEFTGGEVDTIDGVINVAMRHLAAALAACRPSNAQTEATKRAFIDPILILVCIIVVTLLELESGTMQLCMEFSVENSTNGGKIDYVFRLVMALIGLVEAKGEGSLVTYRGQALVEMAAVKQSTIKEGNKRNYDATKTPATCVLTNSTDWEFYVLTPDEEPPVTFRQIATPTDSMLWLDVKKLRARYMPVIEQLVAILMVETQRVQEQAFKKPRVV